MKKLTTAGKFWVFYLLCVLFVVGYCSQKVFACERTISAEYSHYSSIVDGKPFNSIHSNSANTYMLLASFPINKFVVWHFGIGGDADNLFGRNPVGLVRLTFPIVSW